jgi:hypothetical protein
MYGRNAGGSLAQRLRAEGPLLLETLYNHCTDAKVRKIKE